MPLAPRQGWSHVVRRCLLVGRWLLLLSGPEGQAGLLHLAARGPPVPGLMLPLPGRYLPPLRLLW